MSDLRVAVAGAGGRMGGAVIRAVTAAPGAVLQSALARTGSSAVGQDAGLVAGIAPLGVAVLDRVEAALTGAQAIIDFTTPALSVALAREAAERGIVHVIGTTGCSEEDEAAIRAAARAGARIVKAGNFSLGVNVLLSLVRQAAAALPDYDIEILEMHHNRKVDAPSGTALMLGEAAATGRGIELGSHSVRVRDGHTGVRRPGTIGFATLRGGAVIGDHTVILAGENERVEIGHRAQDRAMFASGALRAALWAEEQMPGLYDMADVLGLSK